jgi:hypothetical protein
MDLGNMVNKVVIGIISAVLFILVGVALGPTVLASTADINATTLSGVPLADVIVLLGTYVGAFYYLAIVVGGLAMVWAATRV